MQSVVMLKGACVMASLLKKFTSDERGMETVEWAVLAALIVAGLIGVVAGIGTNVKAAFQKLQDGTKPS